MVVFSDCAECKNFINDERRDTCKCKAFPEGIPPEWFLKGNPKEVRECNNGIGFEPDDERNKGYLKFTKR
ncbi:glutamyl-tRNA amidotransferase [Hornefia butyriciproducens]|uniref:Glutamyl-tRNA amidotransferase n=1 Tax=Hornefia butyriciproducens TaxID=2652293 RepID=A0A6L5Y2J6_9FIRM|nr:glutamyl-tRNA amidotransferase [Hornefia butyriciproducens]MST50919.1 glutamyl-tRNA amidotransferase [Hornefia butyriciproducens]